MKFSHDSELPYLMMKHLVEGHGAEIGGIHTRYLSGWEQAASRTSVRCVKCNEVLVEGKMVGSRDSLEIRS